MTSEADKVLKTLLPDEEVVKVLKEFLENSPVGTTIEIPNFPLGFSSSNSHYCFPSIQLDCDTHFCQTITVYDIQELPMMTDEQYHFLTYVCRHCKTTRVSFAVKIIQQGLVQKFITKIGQDPKFRCKIPSSVLRSLSDQSDREMIKKAADLESQGFGIGSFVYYRRVVENQRNALIDMITKVMRLEGVDPSVIAKVDDAKKTYSFTQSMDDIKAYVPRSVYIDGHNPITLLHSALSLGVHQYDEQKCLDLSHLIREALTEVVSRIGSLTKEQSSLKTAIGKLTTLRQDDGKPQKETA